MLPPDDVPYRLAPARTRSRLLASQISAACFAQTERASRSSLPSPLPAAPITRPERMPSRSQSSSLHAAAAEARASAAPVDPSASPDRPARLASLSALQSELSALQSAFVPPPPGALTFQPTNPSKLAFTAANAPVLAHEDALVKLLTKLDGVESDGDPVVRAERKRVVNAVDHELERLDALKKAEQERAAGRGQKEDELREKRDRVDKLLRGAGQSNAGAGETCERTGRADRLSALQRTRVSRSSTRRPRTRSPRMRSTTSTASGSKVRAGVVVRGPATRVRS